ncbi:MAG: SpoIID/LytB domain-containing protein, partial [Lachnospiraceae bacterium]|nr:SpoIID/LytB domain-containing protein [Lachnospiraceae bacterium]
MDWGIWEIPMEEYLIYKLSDVIPEDYEAEALKAQAVLLRTELIQALKEQEYNNMLLTVDGADRWYETDAD